MLDRDRAIADRDRAIGALAEIKASRAWKLAEKSSATVHEFNAPWLAAS